MAQKTLAELAEKVNARIKGKADFVINGISTLQLAKEGQLSFLANSRYKKFLLITKASAVILAEADLDSCPCAALT